MEEWIGGIWDRWITQTARRDHPAAAVQLKDIEKTLGVLFRALGGDAGLRVATAANITHGARRRLLQRIAGTNERTAHAALDMETLRLPPAIAVFPEPTFNRDLYVWLAALAAGAGPDALQATSDEPWILRNQHATVLALTRYPGLTTRYQRLVAALLAERPCGVRRQGPLAERRRSLQGTAHCPRRRHGRSGMQDPSRNSP